MSLVVLPQVAPPRRPVTPRLIATLALFVVSATLFCTIIGHLLVHRADDRQAQERRDALLGALRDMRGAAAGFLRPDSRTIRGIERTAGLKDLRFEAGPVGVTPGREIQPVVDAQGRIVGWFSWQPDRSMTSALQQLQPLLAMTGLCLIAFLVLALWQVRRAVRDLGRSEALAWTLAHQDMLTRLPNRRKMIELIDVALAARRADEVVMLAFIGLDGLGEIGDALGQNAGDQLLAAFADRLRDALPKRASGGRFDSNEFAIVMTAPDEETAENEIAAAVAALARPYWISEQAVHLGATVGVAHAPLHAGSRDELIRRADLALLSTGRRRGGAIAIFIPAMDDEFNERRFIEREFRRALTDNAIEVHYQPIVTADGSRIVGVEALARWHHPVRGVIPPASFVPVAEQTGLMGRLGEMVLRRALADAKDWPGLSVAVNLSPVQVRDSAMVDLVAEVLEETEIDPSRVFLEVTEGVLIDDPEAVKARFDALRGLGVRLALDDFGTGYSSLAYLQQFHFDKLKIDKAFVAPLGRDAGSQAMIQAIVTLGRALGLTLLAEGVETEEQRVMLRLAGCDEMQGFLFASAKPREAMDRLLAQASRAAG